MANFQVGLLGASGRMGREVVALLNSHDNFGMELSDAVSLMGGIKLRRLSEPSNAHVDVWIDFSRPEATLQLLEIAKCPVVVGTTGFSVEQNRVLEKFSSRIALLVAPNLSVGMNVLKKMLRQLPSNSCEIVLSESHHREKKDSPSGTSRDLADLLKEKSVTSIPIHSSRVGNLLGTHEIQLVLEDEDISITHRALSRRVFARGALLAARHLIGKPAGWYKSEDIFE